MNTVKLKDVTSKIGSGATPRGGKNSYKDDGISLIRSLNVYDLHFDKSGLAFIDNEQAEGLSNVTVEADDVLLNITGASVARCCKVPNDILPARVNQHVSIIRANRSELDPDYLQYLLVSPSYKHKLLTYAQVGATREALTKGGIEDFEVELPSLETQQKIASILSAFDDLIENNTRRIAILEEMARLIYREWFVHFRYPGHEKDELEDSGTEFGKVPEEWNVKRLEEIARVNPENISNDYKGEIEYINISGVDQGEINETEIYDFKDAPGRAKRRVKHGDIIWSSVRPNLKAYSLIMNPPSNQIASTGFAVIRPKKLPASFLYNYLTTDEFVEYLVNHTRGSAYPAVNVADFKNAKIVVPSDELIEKFEDLIWRNYEQIDRLNRMNKRLKETRDLLLPKLISGKVGGLNV